MQQIDLVAMTAQKPVTNEGKISGKSEKKSESVFDMILGKAEVGSAKKSKNSDNDGKVAKKSDKKTEAKKTDSKDNSQKDTPLNVSYVSSVSSAETGETEMLVADTAALGQPNESSKTESTNPLDAVPECGIQNMLSSAFSVQLNAAANAETGNASGQIGLAAAETAKTEPTAQAGLSVGAGVKAPSAQAIGKTAVEVSGQAVNMQSDFGKVMTETETAVQTAQSSNQTKTAEPNPQNAAADSVPKAEGNTQSMPEIKTQNSSPSTKGAEVNASDSPAADAAKLKDFSEISDNAQKTAEQNAASISDSKNSSDSVKKSETVSEFWSVKIETNSDSQQNKKTAVDVLKDAEKNIQALTDLKIKTKEATDDSVLKANGIEDRTKETKKDDRQITLQAQKVEIGGKTFQIDASGKIAPDKAAELSQKPVFSQISGKVLDSIKDGKTTFQMKLQPDGLGNVTVKMVCDGKNISMQINADVKMTQSLLASQLNDLKTELSANNYQVVDVSVGGKAESGHMTNADTNGFGNNQTDGRQERQENYSQARYYQTGDNHQKEYVPLSMILQSRLNYIV